MEKETFDKLYNAKTAKQKTSEGEIFYAGPGPGVCAVCAEKTCWAGQEARKYLCSLQCLGEYSKGPEAIRGAISLDAQPSLSFHGLKIPEKPVTINAEDIVFWLEMDNYTPPPTASAEPGGPITQPPELESALTVADMAANDIDDDDYGEEDYIPGDDDEDYDDEYGGSYPYSY